MSTFETKDNSGALFTNNLRKQRTTLTSKVSAE